MLSAPSRSNRETYFLRQRLADGTTIEQSLIATERWGVEVYVLRRVSPGQTEVDSRPRVSIMMRRLSQASRFNAEDKLIETARVALADERRILNSELEALLLEKFQNPMAGIIGGHLLLVEHERDSSRDLAILNTVVKNLQRLVGAEHPDVVALALNCPDTKLRRVGTLAGPPMLQRSWKLLVEATRTRPKLVPAEMWSRVQAQTSLPPFMVWATDAALKSAVRQDLTRAIWSEVPGPARSIERGVTPPMAAALPAAARWRAHRGANPRGDRSRRAAAWPFREDRPRPRGEAARAARHARHAKAGDVGLDHRGGESRARVGLRVVARRVSIGFIGAA